MKVITTTLNSGYFTIQWLANELKTDAVIDYNVTKKSWEFSLENVNYTNENQSVKIKGVGITLTCAIKDYISILQKQEVLYIASSKTHYKLYQISNDLSWAEKIIDEYERKKILHYGDR